MKRFTLGRFSFAFLILWLASPLPWALKTASAWAFPTVHAAVKIAPANRTGVALAQFASVLDLEDLPINLALAPPTPIPQASCISQAPAGTHGITVCWTASVSSTVTGYFVLAGTVTGGPYTAINTTPATGTSFFYPTPNLGGVKQFIVIESYDGTARSVNSAEVSVTAIGNPLPPTAPAAVAASARWQTEDHQ